MNLSIIDDTDFNLSCRVFIGDVMYYRSGSNKESVYPINENDGNLRIKISKDNIWKYNKAIYSFCMLFYIFDLSFGNLFETDNLPYGINFEFEFDKMIMSDKQIFLSEILSVDKTGLTRWNRWYIIQSTVVSVLIAFVGIIIGFAFDGFLRFLTWALIFAVSFGLFAVFSKKRVQLFEKLKLYV